MTDKHSPICACKECINHRKYNPYYPFVFDEDKKPRQRYISEKALTSELDELCELYGLHKSFTKALLTKIEQSNLWIDKKDV